jgi:hypothetical protein
MHFPRRSLFLKVKPIAEEYQGITGDAGKFSTRLPAGDIYEIFILGFKDLNEL